MSDNHPLVSVIIPVYNGEETIGACLDALFLSDFHNFEVIVMNDGSTDATHEIASAFNCRLAREENAGPGAVRNLGARHAQGDILFFLDADILVRADSLGRMVSVFKSRPEVGALFGSYGKITGPDNFVTVYKNLLHHYTHQTAHEDAATFCGGFGAIRRETFEKVGGFDPRHRFLEDVEMGYRLHRVGTAIALCKEIEFTHCKRYTLHSLIRSDLFGRAVPWTRLMLSARLFRNDLNTRTHNILSVPCSLALAACIPLVSAAGFGQGGIPGRLLLAPAALTVCLACLNWRFLSFLTKEKGIAFAQKGLFMLWLGYVYSAIGVAMGVWLHLITPEIPPHGSRSAVPVETRAEDTGAGAQ